MVSDRWEACWPEGQDRLIVADVAAQSDEVLLAVHQPPRLLEMPVPLPGRRAEAAAQSHEATQEMLLEQLMVAQPREHTLVIPIIGEPGTGKSHLIKWLRVAMPNQEGLVIRHIPREGTSLPEVVRILLEGLEGGRFDDVRNQMDTAKTQIPTLEEAATRLALRLAVVVQYGIPSGWRRAARLDGDLRDSLCDPTVLPALLTDHACRTHLTRVGGPIHRLAADIVNGYQRPAEDDADEELGFRADDLVFTNASLRGAGNAARRAVLNLQMPGFADAAARILSDALDVAAADVIGLGNISLTDVFTDVRAELLKDKKQLVLLFEDMAIARGLQLDLVDAITTPAVRDGVQRLCTLRVALAITASYWDEQAPETLATRISAWGGSMFSLDVPVADTDDVAPVMIGRYLNAARLGVANIRDQPKRRASSVPNQCESCPFDRRDECHALFGATSEGHGLFPLTRPAAVIGSRLANRETFRPRRVLEAIVGPVIADRARLNEGQFPSPNGDIKMLVDGAIQRRALHDLSLAQLEAVESASLSSADRSRAETVLRIWNVQESPDPIGLLRALNLDLPASAIGGNGQPPPAPSRQSPEPGRKPQPAPEDERLQAVSQWAGGRVELSQAIARTLRRSLFDELRAGIRWEEIGFGQESVFSAIGLIGSEQAQMNLAVRIENAAGGGAVGDAKPLIEIRPNAATARLLQGLLLHERHRSWAFPGGMDTLARLRVAVRHAENEIIARLAKGPFARATLTDASRVLVLAAAGLGLAEPSAAAPLAGAVTKVGPVATAGRSRAWAQFEQEAHRAHARSMDLLQAAAGRRQGRGRADITALDWTLIDAKKMARDPAGLQRPPKVGEAHDMHDTLMVLAEAGLAAEAEAIGGVVAAIEDKIGAGSSLTLKTIRDALNDAVTAAKAAHVLRPPDILEQIDEAQLPASTAAAQLLDDARRAVAYAQQGVSIESLTRVARLDMPMLQEISRYLDLVDQLVSRSLEAAAEVIQGNSAGGDGSPSAPARTAIQTLIGDVDQLIAACPGAAE